MVQDLNYKYYKYIHFEYKLEKKYSSIYTI